MVSYPPVGDPVGRAVGSVFRIRRPPRRLAAALLAVALAVVASGCRRVDDRAVPGPDVGPRHVFLIVIDTLRADHLGYHGYPLPTSPNLDRLAAGGVSFTNAFSSSSNTLESTVALFFSRRPLAGLFGPAGPGDRVPVQSLFKRAGFATFGAVANPWLQAFDFFRQDFDHFRHWQGWSPNSSRFMTDRVLELLDEHFRPDRRSFVYLHYLDPHDPYSPPVDYGFYQGPPPARKLAAHFLSQEDAVRQRLREDPRFAGKPRPVEMSAAELGYLIGQYDGEIRYLDEQLGRLIERLQDLEVWEDSLLVVTSDHGEEFLEHGLLKHGFQLYDETTHVPLVFHWPAGLAPAAEHRLASTVDVVPTMLALCGIDVDPRFDGSDLFGPERLAPGLALATHFVNQRQLGMRSSSWKLIEDQASGEVLVFDLVQDPAERDNLYGGEAKEWEALVEPLRELLAPYRAAPEGAWPGGAELDEETRRRLEALGYL